MEIEIVKKIIKENILKFAPKIEEIAKAEKYYANENDILTRKNPVEEKLNEKESDNPLRNADNRISHPWHELLVNQKAAYTMTEPPTFDVGNKDLNDEITKLLGDRYQKTAKDLCIKASNAGIAWVHVWRDEAYKNFFRYAIVDSKQIIPIYSKKLDSELVGVLRVYEDYSDDGEVIVVYEYWNDNEVLSFYKKKNSADKEKDDLMTYDIFDIVDVGTNESEGKTNQYKHGWDKIPFIPFRNNPSELSDLKKYKKLIDVYDKVYGGFVNDIDDIQEIIFVLTNYGGEDKKEFLDDLAQYKMVKVDDDGQGAKGGVETLAVDIPIEARDMILQITREAIFTHGQGVDPQKNIGQNNSGAALKYMYSLLELKASMLTTEFRLGFADLVRFILMYSNSDPDVKINQTWQRTSINNDLEIAEIISKLATETSKENIAKSNPLVDDWENELKLQKQEFLDEQRMEDDYRDPEAEEKVKQQSGDDLDGDE